MTKTATATMQTAKRDLTQLLARISELLPEVAELHGIDDTRYAAMTAAYRAAEHLYDLAEAVAEGRGSDDPTVKLARRGAEARLEEFRWRCALSDSEALAPIQ